MRFEYICDGIVYGTGLWTIAKIIECTADYNTAMNIIAILSLPVRGTTDLYGDGATQVKRIR